MVVLTVNVGRDGAPDRDVFCAGDDLQEEATWYEIGKDIGDGHAGLNRQSAGHCIEAPHPVQAQRRHRKLRSNRCVSIGPSCPPRDDTGLLNQTNSYAGRRRRRQEFGRSCGIVSPAGERNRAWSRN
jgi:hypothetical protein